MELAVAATHGVGVCYGYINGFIGGLTSAEGLAAAQSGICVPKGVATVDLARGYVAFIDAMPAARRQSTLVGMLAYANARWVCLK
jgi:hypothetical protein